MDIIRLNTAYMKMQGDWEELCEVLKTAFKNKGKKYPLCVDLCGPSSRLANFPNDSPIKLTAGDTVYITTNRHVTTSGRILYCDSPRLPLFLAPGNQILIEYGRASLTVQSVDRETEVLRNIGVPSPTKFAKV